MKTRFSFKIVSMVFLLGVVMTSKAQQLPHYSQFSFNSFVTNPAYAGTKPYYQAKTNNRYQWVGVTDAPRTFVLSANGPERNKDMGYGGLVFNDVTGHTSRLGFYGSYAYNLRIKNDIRVSMGLSLGVLQYKIDGNIIDLHDESDNALGKAVYSELVPDADFGILVYSDKWHIGLVAKQLFNYNLSFDKLTRLGFNRLKTHFTMHGGYRYDFDKDWGVEPLFLIHFVEPAPVQVDLGTKVIFRDMIWLGAFWRSDEAVSVMLGYEYAERISFGYSYDIITSELSRVSSGTHELMIGFKFSKIKKRKKDLEE